MKKKSRKYDLHEWLKVTTFSKAMKSKNNEILSQSCIVKKDCKKISLL